MAYCTGDTKLHKFIWIYNHAGVRGNERADSLATKTPITRSLKMGKTDILREIRGNLMRNDMAIEETTRSRLLNWVLILEGVAGTHILCKKIHQYTLLNRSFTYCPFRLAITSYALVDSSTACRSGNSYLENEATFHKF